jgi:hypothetical protein
MKRIWLVLLLLCTLAPAAHAQTGGEVTLVAYMLDGSLWLWRSDTAQAQRLIESQGVPSETGTRAPVLSPGGARIAYENWDDDHALWVVEADGSNPRPVLDAAFYDTAILDQIAWRGDEELYFNTLLKVEDSFYANPADDLWRANVVTGEVTQLFAAGEGGRFALAPDGTQVAFSRPGVYMDDADPSVVSLAWADGSHRFDVFTFPAVSTGSEYHFYATPNWQTDSNYFRVAVPDPDAVYTVEGASVALWEVSIAPSALPVGEAPASYFSVVFNESFWSPDGDYIAYVAQVGDITENHIALCLADAAGADAECVVEGAIGELTPLGWTPGDAYVYRDEGTGAMWMVEPGGAPALFLNEPAYNIEWVSVETFVYYAVESGAHLKIARLGKEPAVVVSGSNTSWLEFSAISIVP